MLFFVVDSIVLLRGFAKRTRRLDEARDETSAGVRHLRIGRNS